MSGSTSGRSVGTWVTLVAILAGLGLAGLDAAAQPTWPTPQPTPQPQPTPRPTPQPGAYPPIQPQIQPQMQAPPVLPPAQVAPDTLASIAEDAWVYGYPLVLMDITRRQSTNVAVADDFRAPVNQFARASTFPSASFKGVVRPNVDTLYASAWLDLSGEPLVLHVPNTGGRYHVLPILDAWTNVFASIGSRTTGDAGGDFLIVGPRWDGAVPPGLTLVRSPTETAWILGRTLVDGPADVPAARGVLADYTLTPLAAWQGFATPVQPRPVEPLLDTQTPPPEVVAGLDAETFFTALADAMKKAMPAPADAATVARFAAIGLVPGQDFQPSPEVRAAIADAPARGLARVRRQVEARYGQPGWVTSGADTGQYGTRYDDRAAIALAGLGANLPADAMYFLTRTDAQGAALDGNARYVLRFPPGEAPPVNAFWSVTLYDEKGYLVENPQGRYALGDRHGLVPNPDGSVDLYIQRDPPPGRETNWLPTPDGPFELTMRLYWPEERVLTGGWTAPPVYRLPSPS